MRANMIYILILLFLAYAHSSEVPGIFGSVYEFTSTVHLHDTSPSTIGYQVSASLGVEYLNNNLLLLKLSNPKLHVMSKKSSVPQGFIPFASDLDRYKNDPFVIELSHGLIKNLYISSKEDAALINIKKGIASLFQFTKSNKKLEETDSSGTCQVQYEGVNLVKKTKSNCYWDGKHSMNSGVWGSELLSDRITKIKLEKGNLAHSIIATENHNLQSSLNEIMQIKISTESELIAEDSMKKESSEKIENIAAAEKLLGFHLDNYKLTPDLNELSYWDSHTKKLSEVISSQKGALSLDAIAKSKSALALLNGIKSAKVADSQAVHGVLTSKKNKKILPQILDILGAVQNESIHKTVVKFLKIKSKEVDLDLCERYLWALSTSPHPQKFIIEDLFDLSKKKHSNDKLWETIVLTLPAIVYRYTSQAQDKESHKFIEQTIDFLVQHLQNCKKDDEACKLVYLRGFSNLPTPIALPHLLKQIDSTTGRSSVESIKAVHKLGLEHWNDDVLQMAEKVFLANATYDSSSRAIALDILLDSRPNDIRLGKILSILKFEDSPRELKHYLLERINQISERCSRFKSKVQNFFNSNKLNQYNTLAQGGLSTAFSREFMEGGSLSTTQEVLDGVLKEGNVHVNFLHNKTEYSVFTLGLFSRGLSSFMSSGGDSGENDDITTAGLQLTVLNVNLRPFVFFTSQGELMGHVWSGTASSITPAYQAILLLQNDYLELPLGIGPSASIKFAGAASVDLSGKIEISIWNRNAQALVQNRAGVAFEGGVGLNVPFVKTQIEFSLFAEPELNLSSDIDFYNTIALCLKLEQPSSEIEYKTSKLEQIGKNKHKMHKKLSETIPIPGKTYALNNKNNEMCNAIHKQPS